MRASAVVNTRRETLLAPRPWTSGKQLAAMPILNGFPGRVRGALAIEPHREPLFKGSDPLMALIVGR
jgi:hypothetical protein